MVLIGLLWVIGFCGWCEGNGLVCCWMLVLSLSWFSVRFRWLRVVVLVWV